MNFRNVGEVIDEVNDLTHHLISGSDINESKLIDEDGLERDY